MGRLLLIVLASIIVTAVLYNIVNRLSPFKGPIAPMSTLMRMVCWFIVLYTPVQLMVILATGLYMTLLNPQNNPVFAGIFTTSHAVLAVMGIHMSKFFHRQNKSVMALLVLNSATAIFYIMSAIIFFIAVAQ